MPIIVEKLRVHPNPWIHNCIDHKGRPAGRCAAEPSPFAPMGVKFVGAKFAKVVELASEKFMQVGTHRIRTAPARHDHRIEYAREAVEVANSPYYRAAIKCGDLLAADAATASAAGIKFTPPEIALAKARADAIAHFDASTGKDAFAKMKELHKHDGEPLLASLPTAPVTTADAAVTASASADKATSPTASAKPEKGNS